MKSANEKTQQKKKKKTDLGETTIKRNDETAKRKTLTINGDTIQINKGFLFLFFFFGGGDSNR